LFDEKIKLPYGYKKGKDKIDVYSWRPKLEHNCR